ncbi:MAG: hypothetical protein ACUVS2_12270 [Candidatus Flexifilum sp.]
MSDLLYALHAARLIQFGQFWVKDKIEPVRFELALLASYPDLLLRITDEIALPPAERLLCTGDALALGVSLSVKHGIPLVYSCAGSGDAGSPELIGAYDIGHPTVLVINVLDRNPGLRALIAHARQVGLQVNAIVAVLDAGCGTIDLPVSAVFQLNDVIHKLVQAGELPKKQADLVLEWCLGEKHAHPY